MDLHQLNTEFRTADPARILEWVWLHFGEEVAVTSSFQTQSIPLLHIISRSAPSLPIFFLDTGFHFPETLAFMDRLQVEWNLNVQVVEPEMGHEAFQYEHGELYRNNPDLCCFINKVEPLEAVRANYDVWISGIRRDQTEHRQTTVTVSETKNGQLKVCPLAYWTEKDVWTYINRNNLPVHPLLSQGYMSIGCAPCTRSIADGGNARSGRWAGQTKTECGIHI